MEDCTYRAPKGVPSNRIGRLGGCGCGVKEEGETNLSRVKRVGVA